MPVLSARLCAYLSEELRMRTEKSDECRRGCAAGSEMRHGGTKNGAGIVRQCTVLTVPAAVPDSTKSCTGSVLFERTACGANSNP